MPATDKLTWTQIDTSALPTNLAKSYAALQKQQAETKKAREAFEADLVKAMMAQRVIPEGREPVFSYRFGNLSVAFQTIKAPKTKPAMIALKAR